MPQSRIVEKTVTYKLHVSRPYTYTGETVTPILRGNDNQIFTFIKLKMENKLYFNYINKIAEKSFPHKSLFTNL